MYLYKYTAKLELGLDDFAHIQAYVCVSVLGCSAGIFIQFWFLFYLKYRHQQWVKVGPNLTSKHSYILPLEIIPFSFENKQVSYTLLLVSKSVPHSPEVCVAHAWQMHTPTYSKNQM